MQSLVWAPDEPLSRWSVKSIDPVAAVPRTNHSINPEGDGGFAPHSGQENAAQDPIAERMKRLSQRWQEEKTALVSRAHAALAGRSAARSSPLLSDYHTSGSGRPAVSRLALPALHMRL